MRDIFSEKELFEETLLRDIFSEKELFEETLLRDIFSEKELFEETLLRDIFAEINKKECLADVAGHSLTIEGLIILFFFIEGVTVLQCYSSL